MAEKLLIATPELTRTGGVQRFSRDVVGAAVDLYGPENVIVFGRNDTVAGLSTLFPAVPVVAGIGNTPAKLRRLLVGRAVRRLARRHRVSAILATHPGLAPAAVSTGLSTAVVTHGIDVWQLSGGAVRDALAEATRVVAVSRFTAQRLEERVPALKGRVGLFPNTFDVERFVPAEPTSKIFSQCRIAPSDRVLTTVTRLAASESPKGYDAVLRVLPSLIDELPNIRYVLAGQGPERDRIARVVANTGLDDHVRLPGFVADDDLPDLYRASDVFVLPSEKEGFGIVFLEAIGCGIPVVGRDAGGIPDALLDGEVGRLVDGSDDDLHNALLDVLRWDDATRAARTMSARSAVAEAFGPASFRERLATLVDSMASHAVTA